MELKQLKIFCALAQELNFTRTAERLGYTQANITIQMKRLEEELQTKLFQKEGKLITLSEDGEKLLLLANRILSIEKAIEQLGKEDPEHGSIRIGVCDSLCISILPNIIEAYKRRRPYVNIYLSILKCSEFYSLLAKNQIDLAYTIGYLRKEEEICYMCETEETICVLAAPSFPLAHKKKLSAADFSGIPLILSEKAAYYRQNFEQELIRNNITPQIMVETESIQAIKKLTEKGLGICVLPKVAALDEIDQQRLVVLDYQCEYEIYSHIIWHKNKQFSACQKEFLQLCEEELR